MQYIRIVTCSSCVRSVSDNKVPETCPFLWNLSQRDSLRVVSGGSEREECTLYRWGWGMQLSLQKDTVFILGWMTYQSCCLKGWLAAKGSNVCIVWWYKFK
jgi:hypothetical protein